MKIPFPHRFWARVARRSVGCWEWEGHKNSAGYGTFRDPAVGQQDYAHRIAYRLERGQTPAGMHIDHLCRNRGCVRPDHMELVTPAENILRGVGPAAINARRTECLHGHPFDDKNTYVNPKTGVRSCRRCVAAATKAWRKANPDKMREKYRRRYWRRKAKKALTLTDLDNDAKMTLY